MRRLCKLVKNIIQKWVVLNIIVSCAGRHIQLKEHSSVEDAQANMDVFRVVYKDWEKGLIGHSISE